LFSITFIIIASIITSLINLSLAISKNDLTSSEKEKSIAIESVKQEQKKSSVSASVINYLQMKSEVSEILGDEIDKFGIVIKNLKSGDFFDINGDLEFPPASVSKIPIAMILLKDIDNGVFSLDQKFVLKREYKMYSTDSMYYLANNSKHTLRTYLDYLIRYSDNTAMTAIEDFLGGTTKINQRFKNELGIKTFFREPHVCTAVEIANVFQQIYDQSFLSKESNDLLIELLSSVGEWMQNRIPKGIPEGANVKVAHKIGDLNTEFGAAVADAGIVFGQKTDYMIIIVNNDVLIEPTIEKIVKISSLVYDYLEVKG
jgi:beta-lactamase class A